jgi:1-deoxy-D-xylulose-5-phosphate reductoisomerase
MTVGVAILGSTGSIGRSTLQVLARQRERFRVVAITGHSNRELLAQQAAEWQPAFVGLVNGGSGEWGVVRDGAKRGTECLVEAATHPDVQIVVNGIVGAAGLEATLAALRAGKRVALANKETLVMAGELMVAESRARGGRLLPIDSEHCALHQCLDGRRPEEVRRLVLTASGGPFRTRPRETFDRITPAEALAHPTWTMGRKITIDSATLMNKGLEVIEARWLFGVGADRVEVIIHPQSVVHSMVEFVDGTVLAQLGVTDMRLPIQYALSHPERWEAAIPGIDFTRALRLEFEAPDHERFPCLGLAYRALEGGGSLPAVLNAANEEAVAAFLDGRIGFTAIPDAIREVMDDHRPRPVAGIDDVLAADAWARERSRTALKRRALETV